MTNQPSVAIIILNWNTSHYLRRFLPSILNTTYQNKEVYVIDNASTDDSLIILKKNFSSVKVLLMEKNIGFAAAYNVAVKEIDADYFLIVNSDIEATEGFIEPLVELMESNKKIGMCQPKLLSLDEKHAFEYAGAAGGWIDSLGYPFTRGRILLTIEKDEGQYDSIEEIFWASGACMLVRNEIFQKTGGFYDYYYMHQEDIDLCWRAYNIGYRICACPVSVVYHIGGGSLSWENHLKTFLTYRNNYILLTRNLPFFTFLPVITLRFILDFMGCVYFIFKGKPGISRAMFKAIFAYVYWLLFVKEKFHGQPRGLTQTTGVYKGTILFAYFRNIRVFSQLVRRKRKNAQNDQFIIKKSQGIS